MVSGSAGERVVTVNGVLDGHVRLDVDCLDRLYLNGYLGKSWLTLRLSFIGVCQVVQPDRV